MSEHCGQVKTHTKQRGNIRRCSWCGQLIEMGERYATWVYFDAGTRSTVYAHDECYDAWMEASATEPHRLGIAGAARVLDEARAIKPRPRCALVLGRMDERRGLDRAAPDLLAGAFAVPVLTVRQDSTLAAALNAGGLPPATGRAAADLEAVAAWIDKNEKGKMP